MGDTKGRGRAAGGGEDGTEAMIMGKEEEDEEVRGKADPQEVKNKGCSRLAVETKQTNIEEANFRDDSREGPGKTGETVKIVFRTRGGGGD